MSETKRGDGQSSDGLINSSQRDHPKTEKWVIQDLSFSHFRDGKPFLGG